MPAIRWNEECLNELDVNALGIRVAPRVRTSPFLLTTLAGMASWKFRMIKLNEKESAYYQQQEKLLRKELDKHYVSNYHTTVNPLSEDGIRQFIEGLGFGIKKVVVVCSEPGTVCIIVTFKWWAHFRHPCVAHKVAERLLADDSWYPLGVKLEMKIGSNMSMSTRA